MAATLGTFAQPAEIKQSFVSLAGPAFLSCLPRSAEDSGFDWLLRKYIARQERRRDIPSSAFARRIRAFLGDDLPDSRVREIVHEFFTVHVEDLWGRWQATRSSDWPITTEVQGLRHLRDAQAHGRGVILWGISFCGTLFPKIALAHEGIELTQLSSQEHGKSYLNTFLGRKVAGPLYCLPEDRYLRERIVIPEDGNAAYLRRIGEVLRDNHCIWMAGDGSRHQRLIAVEILGRSGRFAAGPPVLAMRNGAALIPAHTQRLGRFHYRLTIEAPIELEPRTNRKEAIQSAVQAYADLLSTKLVEQPGSWNWGTVPGAMGSGDLPA